MNIHSTTEPLDHTTVDAVIAGRVSRGLVPMLLEALTYGRAMESGERFTPSSPGMATLLRTLDDMWQYERAQQAESLPFDDSPPWLRACVERGALESRPMAHGIAPLPPLGGLHHAE